MACDQEINHVKFKEVEEIVAEKPVEEVKEVKEDTDKQVEDLFKLTKSEQADKLKDLGLSKTKIRQLKSETERVNKIIELTN